MQSNEMILELEHISKTFPGVKALDNVELRVKKGSVHALMGENGAGKSTLMKILIGLYQPDPGGSIKFNGEEFQAATPLQATEKGISMIHQELMTIPEMTVMDNIWMHRYSTNARTFVNYKESYEKTEELFQRFGISGISPKKKMKDLSIAQMQMVEIAKAISFNSKLIIMDEPTSSISDNEVEILFNIIRTLKNQGIGIIYISHKMEEIFQIADDITVLRDGQYIGSKPASELDDDALVGMMVGRQLSNLYNKEQIEIGEVVFEVKNLSGDGFENISFQVRKGEILGFAGLIGAGRTEVMETIFGLRKATGGQIFVNGKEVKIANSRDAIKNHIALATEDRKQFGLFLNQSITFNAGITWLQHLGKYGFINKEKEKKQTSDFITKLKVKTSSNNVLLGNLSGGNQQKVVLAKWLITEPDILILDEPTRGIDIGAKSEIYKIMEEMVKLGKAVIMISSEMPEIIGVSDRVIVMRSGSVSGELLRDEVTQEQIGKLL